MDRTTDVDGNALLPAIDDTPGPALPLPASRGEALARAAARRAVKRRGFAFALQVAASALLAFGLVGGAAAAVATYLWREAPSGSAGAPARDRDAPAPAARRAKTIAPQQEPAPLAVAAPEPQPEATPAVTPNPEARYAPSASRDLLRRANRLRQRAAWREAERLYAAVARSASDPGDAYAASVAAASLRLEQLGQPRSALALYHDALRKRPRGALAEEVRHGIAECHRALGDARAEARALRELLAAHPSTLLRERAQVRLRVLAADED